MSATKMVQIACVSCTNYEVLTENAFRIRSFIPAKNDTELAGTQPQPLDLISTPCTNLCTFGISSWHASGRLERDDAISYSKNQNDERW